MIALNPAADFKDTKKIRCPECRKRIFDVVLTEQKSCRHNFRVVIDKGSKSKIAVKCSKCGALMMPHRVCKACGSYNKKEIIAVD